jgi:hypothetical protein
MSSFCSIALVEQPILFFDFVNSWIFTAYLHASEKVARSFVAASCIIAFGRPSIKKILKVLEVIVFDGIVVKSFADCLGSICWILQSIYNLSPGNEVPGLAEVRVHFLL